MIRLLRLSFIVLLAISGPVMAQPPGYALQATSGSYTPLSGGIPVILTYNAAANNDDGIATPANAVPIGFSFNYNGNNYTTIRPCANGWASFSSTALANNTDTWTNNLVSGVATNQRPFIAPLWDDMDMSGGSLSYQQSGTAPNRILTIEWSMCKWDYNALAGVISFQVKLYETSNIIEYIYKQESGSIVANGGGASIGLVGSAAGTYLSLTNAGTSPNVSSSVETPDILSKPATGQIYRWIPYCTAAATTITGEKISNFTYNTINNNSSSTAVYENFSNIVTTVSLFPASTLPFSISLSSFVPTDQVLVFIDFNHNGDFSDPGETVYTSGLPLASGTITGNITVPALSSTVLQGRTRMRIRLHDSGSGANATSCGTSTNGQVEDYSIDIQPCFAAAITAQPAPVAICNGGNGSISIGTTGTGLSYQWQVSTNGGTTYNNLTNSGTYTGTTSTTLVISGATLTMNGYLYRVVMNGLCTPVNFLSNAALLTVNNAAQLTSNPVNSTVCEGKSVVFSVTATGSSPSYQWQVSTDGGITYFNVTGANSSSLNFTAVTPNMSLNRYRVIVSVASCGSVTSTGAILKVNPTPVVTLTSAPISQLTPVLTTTLFATSNPAGAVYSWALNGTTVAGAQASTLVANINGLGSYTATVTDINGCTNTTGPLVISGLASNKLFIYPSPSADGIFNVRLFSGIVRDTRKITIYNALGAVVARKTFTTATVYEETRFDFSRMAAGIYTVEVTDRHDVKTAVGRVLIR